MLGAVFLLEVDPLDVLDVPEVGVRRQHAAHVVPAALGRRVGEVEIAEVRIRLDQGMADEIDEAQHALRGVHDAVLVELQRQFGALRLGLPCERLQHGGGFFVVFVARSQAAAHRIGLSPEILLAHAHLPGLRRDGHVDERRAREPGRFHRAG